MGIEKEYGKPIWSYRDVIADRGPFAGIIDMLRYSLGVLTSGISLSLPLVSRAMPFSLFMGIYYGAYPMRPGRYVMILPD